MNVIEYAPGGRRERWRVERFEALAAELAGLVPEALPTLHELFSHPSHARPWLILRRLYGIMPVLIPLDGDADDFRVWSRLELAHALGIDEKKLAAESEAIRLAWERVAAKSRESGGRRQEAAAGRTTGRKKRQEPGVRSQESEPGQEDLQIRSAESGPRAPDPAPLKPIPGGLDNAAVRGDAGLVEEDDALLRRLGFPPVMFQKAGRDPAANLAEKVWFAGQVRAWERLLADARTQGAARQALQNEWRARRAEEESWELEAMAPPLDPDARSIHEKNRQALGKRIAELQKEHRASLQQLQELSPGFGISARELAATGAIGEIIKGIQDYEARGDMALLDGIYSQYGIKALLRTSVQVPVPAYRAGKVAYLNQCKEWLWEWVDPEAEDNPRRGTALSQAEIGALDHAWQEAVREYKEKHGLHVPDLRLNGAEGEYEP